MKKSTATPALRIVLVTLWRLVLVAALLAALVCAGLSMALQTVLRGPSESARDQLTLTLLESAKTDQVPGKFLDEKTIATIISVEYTLDSDVSDPNLITVEPSGAAAYTLENENYTAQVTLGADPAGIRITGGKNYAGFTADGKLILSTSQEEAQALNLSGQCGHILILNGQVNEGLFAATSGFAPRTAIGQLADGTVILVTTDGWTQEHIGATWQDLINIMTHYGAVNACITESSKIEE